MKKLYVESYDGKTFVEGVYTLNFVYATGILEDRAGYDIVCAKNPLDDFYLIEDFITVLPDGEEFVSIAISHNSYILIVAKDDKETLERLSK